MSQTKAQLLDPVDLSIVTADLADDAVTAAKLASNAVVNASVDASAAIAGTKISPDFGSQNVATTGTLASGNLTITSTQPFLSLQDSNNENDFEVGNAGGLFRIRDVDASANRLTITSAGVTTIDGTLNVTSHLDMGDDDVIKLGDSDDFELFHQSSNGNSIIRETGGGILSIQTNGSLINLYDSTNAVTMATFTTGGSCAFKHGSTTRLETTANGASITGRLDLSDNLDMPDNAKIIVGTGDDIQIFHDGSESYVKNANASSNLILESAHGVHVKHGGENMARFIQDGAVEIYYDNSKKLETRSNGVEISGHLSLADNNEIRLGNVGSNGDTRITHVAGSHTEINHVGTGDLILETVNGGDDIMLDSNDDVFIKHAGENMAEFRSDAEVNLYYDNVKTFATQTNGIASFGGEGNDAYVYLFADEGDDNADQWRLQALASSSKLEFRNREDGNYRINAEMIGGGHVKLYNDNSQRFATFAGGSITYGQVRQAQTNGNTRTMKTVVTNGLASGETLSFQDTSLNFHGFGEVTVILKHNSTSQQATMKKFPISIRSTSNAGLGSEIYSISAATAGQSMTVTGTDRGVNVRNNESHSCTCTVILDLIIMA